MGRPIEFFFEGGRSRTGKLLPPRYGLYGMLMEAHKALMNERETPLIFVPVSIVHEYVPEQKSLAQELGGAKKKKESTRQLLGLFGLFAKQFGSIHVRLGKPVEVNTGQLMKTDTDDSIKKFTQDLAFRCFREVGHNMMVTPTSLLAMVLLDEPSGAMVWNDIIVKADAILKYCGNFNVPVTKNLQKETFEKSLERAMDILIGNKKIDVIGREHHGSLYYSIREEARTEILYFKNTILHHFLVPAIIGDAWINLFSGQIKDVKDLKEFFLFQRRSLKHEFYLPTIKQFFYGTLSVVSDAVGRRIVNLDELMSLEGQDLYKIVSKVGIFNRALTYIMEAYYVAGLALQKLSSSYPDGFKVDAFNKKVKEVHEAERKLDRLIRYPESYSIPLTKTALKYYSHLNLIELDAGMIKITRAEEFQCNLQRIEKNLNDLLTINIRVVPS
jgi:glycerol-3-phosphate O-acyltransferase